MHETTGELTVRAAGRPDRLAICTLLQQAWHSAGAARWDQLDALEAGCAALLACRGSQAIGFCLFDLRTLPVTRLSAVAVADGEPVGDVWADLWRAAEQYLLGREARSAFYVGEAPWLLEMLSGCGFAQVNTLISYEKAVDSFTAAGHAAVRLRPVRQADLPAVEAIDASSFPLLWRYPVPMLQAAQQPLSRFTVAEVGRRLVGYQISLQEGSEGQVIRLAVHPDRRREGIGTALLNDTLAAFRRSRARRVALNTQKDNLPSQRLYEALGFQRTGDDLPVLEKALLPGHS